MRVTDFLEQLSYGTLASTAYGAGGEGTIPEPKKPAVIAQINGALSEMFSRDTHKRGYVTFRTMEGRERYPLVRAYAVHGQQLAPATIQDPFIQDSASAPFLGDIVKIIETKMLDSPETPAIEDEVLLQVQAPEVYASGTDRTTPHRGIEMLTFNEILIRNAEPGIYVEVEYRAAHPRITVTDAATQELEIAPIFETALERLVAARLFSGMSGQEHLANGQLLRAEFEQLLAVAKAEDLLQETAIGGVGTGFTDKGFR